MGKRTQLPETYFPPKEQSNVRQFIYRLFEDNCTPEEALTALKRRFDTKDFSKAREQFSRVESSEAKGSRGPRSKI